MKFGNERNGSHSNPLSSANFVSKFFMWWLKDLLQYGSKHNLEDTDLYETLPEDQSQILGDQLEKAWNKQLANVQSTNKKSSLWAVFISVFGWNFIKCISFRFFGHIFMESTFPLLLQSIMLFFEPNSSLSSTNAYFLATIFIVMLIMNTVLMRYTIFQVYHLGMKMKIACSTLIFRKITRLKLTENNTQSIINLLSNDMANIEILCFHAQFLTIVPIQAIILTVMMSHYVGIVTALIGTLLLILLGIPGQFWQYNLTRKLRVKQTIATDKRIDLISEIINGIRAIKMYAWENYFKNLVDTVRRREIGIYLKIAYVNALMNSIHHVFYYVCMYVVVLMYALKNKLMTTAILIPITNILTTLNIYIGTRFSMAVMAIVDANVSIKRVESFLKCEEVESNAKTISTTDLIHDDENSISIKHANVSWSSKVTKKVLDSINIDIKRNGLCVITGPVGSGKSTLLKLILGELSPMSGEVAVNGKVSYSDQQPWIFKKSIRDNIVFADTYDEEKYHKVAEACSLLKDYDQLPYGDKTILDDNGTLLSGGQRTRVHLARAVYRNADIYLLDDPFASVDVQVASKLFDSCVCDLLENKTRVLVISSLQYVTHADLVIVLNNGQIEYQGPFLKSEIADKYLNEKQLDNMEKLYLKENYVNAMKVDNGSENKQSNDEEPEETQELLAKGKMSSSLIKKYIQSCKSYFGFFLWLLACVSMASLIVGYDCWIVIWTQEREMFYGNMTITNAGVTIGKKDSNDILLCIGGLLMMLIIVSIFQNVIFHRLTLTASRTIHNQMFDRLIRGPMKFFQLNSQGQILNRFSEDTGCVDNLLPTIFNALCRTFIVMIAMLLSMIIMNYWLLIPIIAIIYLNYTLYQFYVPTIRSIRRLASAGKCHKGFFSNYSLVIREPFFAKSPVLSSAASCFTGMSTIRSCHAEKLVIEKFNDCQDYQTRAHFLFLASTPSYCLSMDLLTNLLFTFVLYGSIIFKDHGLFPGYVELYLQQIIKVIIGLPFMVNIVNILAYMINLERMVQFTKLEQEDSIESEHEMKVSSGWPSKGEVIFQNIYLRYSDKVDPALKDINLIIEPGTKVGIVGRTGAGKSSLVSALFRLAKFDGSLFIDGVDIKSVALSDLRSRISIIPQDPTLFNTTLRNNLDPLNNVDDETLWSALDDVQLKSTFNSLQYNINKNGANLSFGQRQLICLARTIVKRNKIIVLDEATSNVDPATDELIQKTIRSKFEGCTVITIAHKLITVMDCDKVLVMNNGQVVEYEHPNLLLQNKNGYFSQMVNQVAFSGMIEEMKTIARETYSEDQHEEISK